MGEAISVWTGAHGFHAAFWNRPLQRKRKSAAIFACGKKVPSGTVCNVEVVLVDEAPLRLRRAGAGQKTNQDSSHAYNVAHPHGESQR